MTVKTLVVVSAMCSAALITHTEAGTWQSVGVGVGETSGFSYRSLQEGGFAFEAGVGWSIIGEDAVQVYAAEELEFDVKRWDVYAGVGLRIKFQDNTLYGFRFPIGAIYNFQNSPCEVFLEASPLLDVSPEWATHISVGGGLRWRLK